MKKLTRLLLITIIILMLAACESTQDSIPTSSGIIEAAEVSISTQFPGNIAEIFVSEGDSVIKDQVLFRIEDQFLETQITQAELAYDTAVAGQLAGKANLDLANASLDAATGAYNTAYNQYELVLLSSRLAEFPDRTTIWNASPIVEFDLPNWYFTRSEDISAAEVEVETSYSDLTSKENQLSVLIDESQNEELKIAEISLSGARAKYLVVYNIYLNYQGITVNQDVFDKLSDLYNEALDELENAQSLYDDIISGLENNEILDARVELSVAQQRYESSLDYLTSLRTGNLSPQVLSAQGLVTQAAAAIKQAEAGVALAQANLSQIDLSVDLAQSNLQLLEIQKESLSIKSPSDGVVLVSSIEFGELVGPGQVLMNIGKLDQLSVTVFVPEDQYGAISLGDTATFTTDSYPDRTFSATVTLISDQAEFTPSNVQTEEERRTTVYGIELSINNPDVQLIPGMPIQVSFD